MHRGRRNVLSITMMDRKRGHGLNCSRRVLGCYKVLGHCTEKSSIKEQKTLQLVPQKTRGSVKGNINQMPCNATGFLNGPQAFDLRLIPQKWKTSDFLNTTHFHKEMLLSYKYNSNRDTCILFIQRREYPFSNTRLK